MFTLSDEFQLESASRPGREHQRSERNNQDALSIARDQRALVLVVADGCSQGGQSELGAVLGARWLARCGLARHDSPEALAEQLDRHLLARLAELLASLDPDARAETIAESLLFSWLLARVTPELTWVLGCGDGCWSLDRQLQRRAPGPDNAPPYSAYGLVEGMEAPRCEVLATLPTSELHHLVLASDGLEDLPPEAFDELLDQPGTNPQRLPRLLRRHARALPDDTSVLLLRRRA